MTKAVKPAALVVEDDEILRSIAAVVLEETDMHVFQCESAEAASALLERVGDDLCLIFTDVNLAGTMSGAELAALARSRFPRLTVVVTSGRSKPPLPDGTSFIQKPWRAAELMTRARDACHQHGTARSR
jgi:DNA-binding NtrC family response regulator